ncbi:MAG: FAD-dependent oxidoreductase, partial [Leptospiraceae bacterium]|nr:FAD-dependent oxidoreductase [Leptospiraceae bacterium]
IYTDHSLGVPFDVGAAWIHGPKGNPISDLAKKANTKTFVTNDESIILYDNDGEIIPDSELGKAEKKFEDFLEKVEEIAEEEDEDIPLSEAMKEANSNYLDDSLLLYQISSYLEFDYGGPIEKLSAWNYESDEAFEGEDIVLPEGYSKVIDYLQEGLDIRTNQEVKLIDYGEDGVLVETNEGEFESSYVLITVPLGVLKKNSIEFDPELPSKKKNAIKKVAMGNVNKVALEFEEMFWDDKQYIGYIPDEKGKYSYFLNAKKFCDSNILVTLGFGNFADEMEDMDDEEIISDVMEILSRIYGEDIPDPKNVFISRWRNDPYSYGAYSYNSVGTNKKDFETLAESVEDVLFFAGEHTSADYRGTVHGAYLSGLRAADEILEEE